MGNPPSLHVGVAGRPLDAAAGPAALGAVKFKDYYEVLGVGRDASPEEVRAAFRRLARQFHPDVAVDKPAAEERFKELNEAYEVLGDPEKRRKYDALGHDWGAAGGFAPDQDFGGFPGTAWHFEGTGFSDFFENVFGGRAGGFAGFPGGARPGGAGRGGDVHSELLVSLDEVLHGAERTLVVAPAGAPDRHAVKIRIPVGVSEGQVLRVPGHGQPGRHGGPPGDLFLKVRLERHPDFQVAGPDIVHELRLAPWEAVLGATVSVPTPHGPARIKVPPGTAVGTTLRVRGKGLPSGQRHGFGDLLVTIAMATPTATTSAERQLWQALADTSSFQPR